MPNGFDDLDAQAENLKARPPAPMGFEQYADQQRKVRGMLERAEAEGITSSDMDTKILELCAAIDKAGQMRADEHAQQMATANRRIMTLNRKVDELLRTLNSLTVADAPGERRIAAAAVGGAGGIGISIGVLLDWIVARL